MKSQSRAKGQILRQEQESPSPKEPGYKEGGVGELNTGTRPNPDEVPITDRPPAR